MPGPTYSVREAADRLNVSRFTIIKWVKAGKLRAYRVGDKLIRIPVGEVERMEVPFTEPVEES